MGKIISNEEFNTELTKPDIQAIMGSASAPFRQSIDCDELHNIKLVSLWNAMRTWNPNGRKFTSYLYQAVRWGCIKAAQDKAKNLVYDINFDRQAKRNDNFDEMIEHLPEDLRGIFVKRFVHSKTLREIGKEFGKCPETIRRRLIKGVAILRESQ
jgi:RNA polymerase sigma factor (sigma-70 family)